MYCLCKDQPFNQIGELREALLNVNFLLVLFIFRHLSGSCCACACVCYVCVCVGGELCEKPKCIHTLDYMCGAIWEKGIITFLVNQSWELNLLRMFFTCNVFCVDVVIKKIKQGICLLTYREKPILETGFYPGQSEPR